MSLSHSAAIAQLASLLGSHGWLEDDADTLKYRTDWRAGRVGEALGVARPATTEQTAATVKIAREAGFAVVPQGGNTGLVQGGIPTETCATIMVSMDRMNQVRALDADNYALVAEAGCVVQRLQEVAAETGRLFPLSLASEGSCTIGGALSTNAGGNQTIRFGNAREQVLGLEVVMADGTVFDGLNTLRKNNTGYDLKQLFIGAEGTLGIITAAAVRLMPLPCVRETAFLAVPNPHAAQRLLTMARELSGDLILAFELLPRFAMDMAFAQIEGTSDPLAESSPWYVLMELATASPVDDLRGKLERIVGDAMEAGDVTDGVVAESEAQRANLWRPREEQAEARKRFGQASIGGDVSVPVARTAQFLDQSTAALNAEVADLRFNTFGHMGDGNIHYSVFKPTAMSDDAWLQRAGTLSNLLNTIVYEFGGSFSAEHGIGSQKRDLLEKFAAPSKLAMMRAVKEALDPAGLMNPGKVFPA
jgi:FAD/FMN-containing dehydrogenase